MIKKTVILFITCLVTLSGGCNIEDNSSLQSGFEVNESSRVSILDEDVNKNLVISDFEFITAETTFEEVKEVLGFPNGMHGSGYVYYIYDLKDGKKVEFLPEIYLKVFDDDSEYYLFKYNAETEKIEHYNKKK